mgnify:CR=1 FL=1
MDEQDFWGHPDTVNLYEGNAGGLYIGQSIGPWYRMDNSTGKTTFAEDAAALVAGDGEWEEPLDENPSRAGCPIVAEYRDGRTRYTLDAYARNDTYAGSARPGRATRAYVGPDAEGYEADE